MIVTNIKSRFVSKSIELDISSADIKQLLINRDLSSSDIALLEIKKFS